MATFAALLGVKPPTLHRHETERNILSQAKILRAAELLKADPTLLDARLKETAEKLAILSENVSH